MRPWATRLVLYAGNAGLQPRITSTRRSHAEQARLYRAFLQGRNPYPVAPPGESAHEYGYAFDLAITPMSDRNLRRLGAVWQGWGGVWGGQFNDPIHFEFPGFPHKAVAQSLRVRAANLAAGFLPGPLGIVASLDPDPLFVDDQQPWWRDPQGYLHGLYQVFSNPLKR